MSRQPKDKYLKIVEWSEEDQCYVGTAPGLIIGGVHGKNEAKVFAELSEAVDEAIHLLKKDGSPLPKATANRKFSGSLLLRIPPSLHKLLAIKALKAGESINKFIQKNLEAKI
jgi:predicted HicB family RNase H-like nuclease